MSCPEKGNLESCPGFPGSSSKVQRKVALEWGLDFPYVPLKTMDIIENSWVEWKDDLVWEYLHIPKPLQVPECEETWARFKDIWKKWQLGRSINKERVIVARMGRPMKSHSVSAREEGVGRKRLPDPHFYA